MVIFPKRCKLAPFCFAINFALIDTYLLVSGKSCGSAGEVENGDLNYEGTEFGDKLVVTCKTGLVIN